MAWQHTRRPTQLHQKWDRVASEGLNELFNISSRLNDHLISQRIDVFSADGVVYSPNWNTTRLATQYQVVVCEKKTESHWKSTLTFGRWPRWKLWQANTSVVKLQVQIVLHSKWPFVFSMISNALVIWTTWLNLWWTWEQVGKKPEIGLATLKMTFKMLWLAKVNVHCISLLFNKQTWKFRQTNMTR